MSHLGYYDSPNGASSVAAREGWNSGPVPSTDRVIANLRKSNDILREALQDAKRESRARKFTAFWRGACFGAVVAVGAFIGSAAWSETIQIGRQYIQGESFGATTVTIEPSDEPGQLAVVTLDNRHVNQGADTGVYTLTMDGVTFGVQFVWDHDPVLGSDRIVITPPTGITCEPSDCGVTVMEGMTGSVVLFEYNGA